MSAATWDLTALLNAAQPRASLAERNLWLARLLEWLRHPGTQDALPGSTPLPLRRLKHLLGMLERHPEHAQAFADTLAAIWRDVDAVSLFADVGFAPRVALWSEFFARLRQHVLPKTTDTADLGELFSLLFPEQTDEAWLQALDDELLQGLAALLERARPTDGPALPHWREVVAQSLTALVSGLRASGLSSPMRRRMSPELIVDQPFEQLARAADRVLAALPERSADLAPALMVLRALLSRCREAVQSIPEHLEAHGVSVDIMFAVEQMLDRVQRIEELLDCLVAEHPERALARLTAHLVKVVHERRSIGTLFSRHYSLLARKVAERSAETGEHYITRDRDDYRDMLLRAAGGGAVIAATTFGKFGVAALGLTAFWTGFWSGTNYALSFVLIHLLHWTVATKQPAMTAPAMADKLQHIGSEAGLASFVDEVAHLLRSQIAGIVGNLAMVVPLVLLGQGLWWVLFGTPAVGEASAHYVLHSLTLLGPSALFAAFTGVLLFASSLIAGWVENWFVFHRLDSALAWNPRIIARLGAARAQRWAHWWRGNISGMAANVSLGLMLGVLPAVLGFLGLPLEVRHVTLSTGQLAAAVGALGWDLLREGAFWWCVAGIACTGVLNLGVSFTLAFRVALRSRGIRLADRARVRSAIWQRLKSDPRSFLLPPRQAAAKA